MQWHYRRRFVKVYASHSWLLLFYMIFWCNSATEFFALKFAAVYAVIKESSWTENWSCRGQKRNHTTARYVARCFAWSIICAITCTFTTMNFPSIVHYVIRNSDRKCGYGNTNVITTHNILPNPLKSRNAKYAVWSSMTARVWNNTWPFTLASGHSYVTCADCPIRVNHPYVSISSVILK